MLYWFIVSIISEIANELLDLSLCFRISCRRGQFYCWWRHAPYVPCVALGFGGSTGIERDRKCDKHRCHFSRLRRFGMGIPPGTEDGSYLAVPIDNPIIRRCDLGNRTRCTTRSGRISSFGTMAHSRCDTAVHRPATAYSLQGASLRPKR